MSNSYLQPVSKSPSRLHRPQPQSQRTSMSSDSSSTSSSASFSSYNDFSAPRVETLRCSRCAKCVETVVGTARAGNGDLALGRVSTDDASASGMEEDLKNTQQPSMITTESMENTTEANGKEWEDGTTTHDEHEETTTSAFTDSYTNILSSKDLTTTTLRTTHTSPQP
ncbi:hypothetical protein LSUB1_G005773 [Lachnellula subtilissima]|uniref:Uncharacterized protein n=1 Tax=Lachnellula subtilissima TaxID=602034 RepID=A0A8H8RH38_9HELO|nr:hypothetical protein LSUB1_G005773 [Lachnellula subtilissima]